MKRMPRPTLAPTTLPSLPKSWSELTWQQLNVCWQVKMYYGGNADVARVAALLTLTTCKIEQNTDISKLCYTDNSGEKLYRLRDKDGCRWTITAREAAYLAKQSIPWFDYPYGDPGEKAEYDKSGKEIKPRREPVLGYVSPMRDAMILPEEYVVSCSKHFALPQVACNNITWQQYRSLQAISAQLFQEGISDDQAHILQAQFLAHCLVPRSVALLDTSGGSIRLRPHYEYKYNAEQADSLAKWFGKRMKNDRSEIDFQISVYRPSLTVLFHLCFQVYQTAIAYYAIVYPLLFNGSDKEDPLRDALTGEVGTINTVMKYAGYTEQQQVYDSNLPFVLDILNTMTKEAKEIEKVKSKTKK